MKLNFNELLGSKPSLYGRRLLKDMGICGHYVDECEVADFLGYEIRQIQSEMYTEYPQLRSIFDIACAHLLPRENLILVNSNMHEVRRRLSVFHECGHSIQPTHSRGMISCCSNDIDPTLCKRLEQEAFICGAEMMFPLKYFVDDSSSLGLEIDSIRLLAERYNGSLEATAIRYAHTNRKAMAIIVVKSNKLHSNKGEGNPCSSQTLLSLNGRPIRETEEAEPAPLVVQYFVRSHRFQRFIRPGTEISKNNIIFEAWENDAQFKSEIPAATFGSSKKIRYYAECAPLGICDRVMVLLWLPDKQEELFGGTT